MMGSIWVESNVLTAYPTKLLLLSSKVCLIFTRSLSKLRFQPAGSNAIAPVSLPA